MKIADNFTTTQISKICGVSLSTISLWIDKGKIPSYKTLGGHRRVTRASLIKFLKDNNFPIPGSLNDLNRLKILIVDNDPAIIQYIEKILKTKDNYEVSSATDGFKAGHVLSDFHPNLVIFDIKLPGVDNNEICRILRAKNKFIKIIAVSGQNTKENKDKIIQAGADIFLPKPFSPDELLNTINKLTADAYI